MPALRAQLLTHWHVTCCLGFTIGNSNLQRLATNTLPTAIQPIRKGDFPRIFTVNTRKKAKLCSRFKGNHLPQTSRASPDFTSFTPNCVNNLVKSLWKTRAPLLERVIHTTCTPFVNQVITITLFPKVHTLNMLHCCWCYSQGLLILLFYPEHLPVVTTPTQNQV